MYLISGSFILSEQYTKIWSPAFSFKLSCTCPHLSFKFSPGPDWGWGVYIMLQKSQTSLEYSGLSIPDILPAHPVNCAQTSATYTGDNSYAGTWAVLEKTHSAYKGAVNWCADSASLAQELPSLCGHTNVNSGLATNMGLTLYTYISIFHLRIALEYSFLETRSILPWLERCISVNIPWNKTLLEVGQQLDKFPYSLMQCVT